MKIKGYFSKAEMILFSLSIFIITAFFILFDRQSYLTFTASIIGVTSLIFSAKANPIGQVLMIVFSLLYGLISFSFSYYGEMITYLGMTLPMSVFALISWLKNPYNQSKSEVAINRITNKEIFSMCILTLVVTIIFYYILSVFNTVNIVPSTISITTSFIAVYLTYKRSPYFAIAYASNDVVLIVLWSLACTTDIHYISTVICFIAFLFNDIYGYVNWKRIEKRQRESC